MFLTIASVSKNESLRKAWKFEKSHILKLFFWETGEGKLYIQVGMDWPYLLIFRCVYADFAWILQHCAWAYWQELARVYGLSTEKA